MRSDDVADILPKDRYVANAEERIKMQINGHEKFELKLL